QCRDKQQRFDGPDDVTGLSDRAIPCGEREEERAGLVEAEPGAAGVFANLYKTEYRAEGAPTGNYNLRSGTVFPGDDHAAGNDNGAGSAQPGSSRRDFQDRAPILGASSGVDQNRSVDNVTCQRAGDRFSAAGQRIPGGDGGRSECRARDDDSSFALFGGSEVAAGRG